MLNSNTNNWWTFRTLQWHCPHNFYLLVNKSCNCLRIFAMLWFLQLGAKNGKSSYTRLLVTPLTREKRHWEFVQVKPAPPTANKQKYAFPVELVDQKVSQVPKVTYVWINKPLNKRSKSLRDQMWTQTGLYESTTRYPNVSLFLYFFRARNVALLLPLNRCTCKLACYYKKSILNVELNFTVASP